MKVFLSQPAYHVLRMNSPTIKSQESFYSWVLLCGHADPTVVEWGQNSSACCYRRGYKFLMMISISEIKTSELLLKKSYMELARLECSAKKLYELDLKSTFNIYKIFSGVQLNFIFIVSVLQMTRALFIIDIKFCFFLTNCSLLKE